MNDPQGSIWRKWDLHYHTPSSYDVKSSISDDEIIDELSSREISAVAITDHHVIELERIKSLQSIAGDKLTVFPGIELRSELGGREPVHYIGIFDPEADLEHIWTTLQGKLGLTVQHIVRKGGDDSVYVELKKGADVIHELGGLVSVHAGNKSNSIERIPHDAQYQRAVKVDLIAEYIDILEAKDAQDAENYFNIVFKNIETIRPVIVGSDKHHRPDDVDRATCWIKADTTMAGLRRILTEPNRVYIGSEPPSIELQSQNSTRYCKSISFSKVQNSTLDEHWFDGKIVPLNTGLVAIIGNKGSGKSALSDSLALAGNSRRESNFSFLHRSKFRNQREKKAEQFEVELQWLSKKIDKCKLSDNVNPTAVESIKYIPQSYLESICNDLEQGKDRTFDHELKNVIYSHVPSEHRLGKDTFDGLIDFKTNETNEHIRTLQNQIHDLNEEIVIIEHKLTDVYKKSLEEQLNKKSEELAAHLKSKPNEIQQPDKLPEVETTNAKLTEEITTLRLQLQQNQMEIVELVTKNKECLQRKAWAEKLKAKLQNLQHVYDEFIRNCTECGDLKLTIADIITFEIHYEYVQKIIDDADKEHDEFSNKLNEEVADTPANKKITLQQEITTRQRQLDAPNQQYQQYLERLESWKTREQEIIGSADIPDSKRFIEAQIEGLDALPETLNSKKEERASIVNKVHQEIDGLVKTYKSLYKPIEQAFEKNPIAVNKRNIGFNAQIVESNFEEKFFDLIQQGRRGTFYGGEDGLRQLRTILNEADFSSSTGTLAFVDGIERALQNDLRKGEGGKVNISDIVRVGIKPIDVYDFVFGLSYLSPRYALTWGGTPIEQLSPGERGALLLVFYLLADKDTIPLVIDQPEENLDNETVYELLVPCIKYAKESRQVIIVTHNPNLAVVCDADQVIYCEIDKSNKNRITYTSGAVENPAINKHLVDVLEGTRPAFDNRDSKYRLVKN